MNSLGASGGIEIIWKRNFLNLNYSFSGPGYVGVNDCRKGKEYNFVNIYGPVMLR